MAKYTFYKYNENVTSVEKVNANTANTPTHTLVSINAGAVAVSTDVPAVGDFLVWRQYPEYGIHGDRYGKTKTPIATGVGELYGFKLKTGDELIVEDATGVNGINVGDLIRL